MTELSQALRVVEALLFASPTPLTEAAIAERLPDGADVPELIDALAAHYHGRGVTLMPVAGGWAFRTALDLAPLIRDGGHVVRRMTRAALETLAIIAYHQPVTRPEIEAVRAVATSKGTLDTLLEAGWIAPGRRRQAPGRPLTWVTTQGFLDHFGLGDVKDLPGLDELKASGLLDTRPAMAVLPGGSLSGDDEPEPRDDDDRE
jgi:segregation and condensation protein B